METGRKPALQMRRNGGVTITESAEGRWRLELPPGPAGPYRWAQLDDYMHRSRSSFPWKAPLSLRLKARVSAPDLPGTWGFGFWNDPFSFSLGVGGTARRIPALPNTAWFFSAGAPNHLAFRDDHPAQGFLAATFSSPRLPGLLLAPGGLALPLLFFPPLARLARRWVRRLVNESAALVPGDPTEWHAYRLDWLPHLVQFFVDDQQIFETAASPRGPLGLAIWIDNQYAAFPPDGRLKMGTSAYPERAWLELDDIRVSSLA